MASETSYKYSYKIIPEAPPQPIPEAFPLSDLDRNDGFIHMSTKDQVPATCDRFFANSTNLWLFKFEISKFTDPVKWEQGFPHLYGNFGNKDILATQKFERKEGSTWADTMRDSAFLE